jgi:hypothetical protein
LGGGEAPHEKGQGDPEEQGKAEKLRDTGNRLATDPWNTTSRAAGTANPMVNRPATCGSEPM